MPVTNNQPDERSIGSAAPASRLKELGGLVNDIVGPWSLLVTGVAAFSAGLAKSVTEARRLQQELSASEGAKSLTRQFEQLGMSAKNAQQWVGKLASLSATSSFEFSSLGQASKNLQVLGGSSANTTENLRKMMDVSAATGQPVEEVSAAFATLTDQLKHGDTAAAGTAKRLADMGAITQETGRSIARMAEAGAPAANSLRILNRDIDAAKGASDALNDSLVGLSAQLSNMRNASDAKIGAMFSAGAAIGLRAEISKEKIREAANQGVASIAAPVSNFTGFLKEKIWGGISAVAAPVAKPLAAATTAVGKGVEWTGLAALGGLGLGAGKILWKGMGGTAADVKDGALSAARGRGIMGSLTRGALKGGRAVGEFLETEPLTKGIYQSVAKGLEKAAVSESGKFRSIGSTILQAIRAGFRVPLGGFATASLGVGAAFVASSMLYDQYQKQYVGAIQQRESDAKESGRSSGSLGQNLRDSKLGGALGHAAVGKQEEVVADLKKKEEEAKKRVEEAEKNDGIFDRLRRWQTSKTGNSWGAKQLANPLLHAFGLGDLGTTVSDELTLSKEHLSSVQGDLSNAQKGEAIIRAQWEKRMAGKGALERAALDPSREGEGMLDSTNQQAVAALRVQQRYAPDSQARLNFKKQADDLEDARTAMKLSRHYQDLYGVSGLPDGPEKEKAYGLTEQLGQQEVQYSRLMANADEQGTPEVSSMARLGGSAGFAGVVGGPDKQNLDQIKTIAEAISRTLEKLTSDVASGTQAAKAAANKVTR